MAIGDAMSQCAVVAEVTEQLQLPSVGEVMVIPFGSIVQPVGMVTSTVPGDIGSSSTPKRTSWVWPVIVTVAGGLVGGTGVVGATTAVVGTDGTTGSTETTTATDLVGVAFFVGRGLADLVGLGGGGAGAVAGVDDVGIGLGVGEATGGGLTAVDDVVATTPAIGVSCLASGRAELLAAMVAAVVIAPTTTTAPTPSRTPRVAVARTRPPKNLSEPSAPA